MLLLILPLKIFEGDGIQCSSSVPAFAFEVIVEAMRTNVVRFRELAGHAEKLGLDVAPLDEPVRQIEEYVAELKRVVASRTES